MPKRIQRGSVRVESGSWFGYWNTYYHQDTPDRLDTIKKRKQKCVKLGPAGRSGISESQAKDLLREKIKESEQQGERLRSRKRTAASPSRSSPRRIGYTTRLQSGEFTRTVRTVLSATANRTCHASNTAPAGNQQSMCLA
jgi:hypothetical protein